MDPENFGNFIAQRRKELGMTQLQLGQILHVSDKTISRWERGSGFPEISILPSLADALHLNISELMNSRRDPVKDTTSGNADPIDADNIAIINTLEIAQSQLKFARYKCCLALILSLISEICGIFLACLYIEDLTARSLFLLILLSVGVCISSTLGTLIRMK